MKTKTQLKKELQKILDQADCETENCDKCKYFSGKGGNHCEAPEITAQVLNLFEDSKPTKDKNLIVEITAELYGDFHTWKETSYYGLSKLNQKNWRTYGENVAEIIEKLGYRKVRL